MNKENDSVTIPLKLGPTATHYCKFCNTWSTPKSEDKDLCSNCLIKGYLIPNPFPDNLVPYITFPYKALVDE